MDYISRLKTATLRARPWSQCDHNNPGMKTNISYGWQLWFEVHGKYPEPTDTVSRVDEVGELVHLVSVFDGRNAQRDRLRTAQYDNAQFFIGGCR